MLMERHAIDAWVLVAREYNEDPVVRTMLPSTWLSARRRTILVFTQKGALRCAVARYEVDGLFPRAWDPDSEPDQWRRVAQVLAEAEPATIAIDTSTTFALADGLSRSEYGSLIDALGAELRSRLVSGEALALGWLETRVEPEVEDLAAACRYAHDILRRGLSGEAITPDRTTTHDLEWWYREEVAAAKLTAWFHPSVSVQRNGSLPRDGFTDHPGELTIRPGDLVHVDFGIEYLGLHTDQQQHGYVLRAGEQTAPEGLRRGLAAGNRAQGLLMAEFVAGRTGNEVLAATRSAAAAEGIDATIYSHPIGLHGHAAGPTIGLWDEQGGVEGAGDYPLYPDTAYSLELSVATPVPEWGNQPVRIMLEEDAFFDGAEVRLLDGRQTGFWLIG